MRAFVFWEVSLTLLIPRLPMVLASRSCASLRGPEACHIQGDARQRVRRDARTGGAGGAGRGACLLEGRLGRANPSLMSQCHCAADHMNSMMGSCSVPWLQRKLRSVLQISNTALLSAGSQIEPQRAQPVPVGHTHLNTSLGSCDPRCLTASNFQHGGQARRHSVRGLPPSTRPTQCRLHCCVSDRGEPQACSPALMIIPLAQLAAMPSLFPSRAMPRAALRCANAGLKDLVMCENLMSFWKWQLAERGEGSLSPAQRLKWQVFTQRQHAQHVH